MLFRFVSGYRSIGERPWPIAIVMPHTDPLRLHSHFAVSQWFVIIYLLFNWFWMIWPWVWGDTKTCWSYWRHAPMDSWKVRFLNSSVFILIFAMAKITDKLKLGIGNEVFLISQIWLLSSGKALLWSSRVLLERASIIPS